ncbi:hypothetical protein HMPREF0766_11255 [Sphingobacterium spiritivorum ATCC 33861]|uniref:Uncharacterized protein n=1 Tax=Sphingobacterium spiritivorum ATCC 33861 TaxID=525373 RepID=D7VJT6_SPHSI|nr:hypothetical protein HMPREF0766_11255 [Sphingobacterium spiritivorum ATCC 33861]
MLLKRLVEFRQIISLLQNTELFTEITVNALKLLKNKGIPKNPFKITYFKTN